MVTPNYSKPYDVLGTRLQTVGLIWGKNNICLLHLTYFSEGEMGCGLAHSAQLDSARLGSNGSS